jgi:hypothetical protein
VLIVRNAPRRRLSEEVARLRDVDRRRSGSTLIVGGGSRMNKVIDIAKMALGPT